MGRLVQNLARAPCCELLLVVKGAISHLCLHVHCVKKIVLCRIQAGRAPTAAGGDVGILRLKVGEQHDGASIYKRRSMLCRVRAGGAPIAAEGCGSAAAQEQ